MRLKNNLLNNLAIAQHLVLSKCAGKDLIQLILILACLVETSKLQILSVLNGSIISFN